MKVSCDFSVEDLESGGDTTVPVVEAALQGDGVAAACSDDVALDGGVSIAIVSLVPLFEAALQGDGVAVVDSLGEAVLDGGFGVG